MAEHATQDSSSYHTIAQGVHSLISSGKCSRSDLDFGDRSQKDRLERDDALNIGHSRRPLTREIAGRPGFDNDVSESSEVCRLVCRRILGVEVASAKRFRLRCLEIGLQNACHLFVLGIDVSRKAS